jgi:putative tryptophan/tyrosine transport system substrate-binding protein
MTAKMKRRDFITLLGGAAAAWPLAARAQQSERVRRIGVLLSTREDDPQRRAQLAALMQRLTELGWADGRNARPDVRWTAGSADAARKYAAELVALAPDVIITDTSFDVAAVQRATRTVPIVFGGVIDPVGAGLVDSLARPGGNTTGFIAFEYAIGAKWLELLKEVAPHVTRAHAGRPLQAARGLPLALFRQRRRPDVVRVRPCEPVPLGGPIRRSHSQRREAGRPAGAGANEV